jgi:thioredoxin 1
MQGKFENIIASEKPVLVDFYAEWCGPCKAMPPVLKQVKEALGDQVRIIKVDVDHNPAIAGRYGIRSVPTLMLFRQGRQVWSASGVRPADEIRQVLLQTLRQQA